MSRLVVVSRGGAETPAGEHAERALDVLRAVGAGARLVRVADGELLAWLPAHPTRRGVSRELPRLPGGRHRPWSMVEAKREVGRG